MDERMKIVELYIDNFKSFKDCFIPLEDFNIVVAPNNAGKSNLVQSFEFIQYAISKGVEEAVSEFGGIETIKNYRNLDKEIKFGITFFKDFSATIFFDVRKGSNAIAFKDLWTRLNLSIRVEEQTPAFVIVEFIYEGKFTFLEDFPEEFFIWDSPDDGERKQKRLLDFLKKRRYYSFSYNCRIERDWNSNEGEFVQKFKGVKKYKNTFLKSIGVPESLRFQNKGRIQTSDIFLDLQRDLRISPISVYYFRSDAIKGSLGYKGGNKLDKFGRNLASVLSFIREKRKDLYELISSSLIGIVEELKDIEIKEDELGREKLLFKEKLVSKDEKLIPIDIVSDGTVNLVATLVALYEPYSKSIVVMEEPERHLHLKAIEYILNFFRSISDEEEDSPLRKQILITTQSSEVLKNVDLREDNLIFLFRDYEGNTKAVSHRNIPNLRRELKLCDGDIITLIKSNALGYLGDYLYEDY